jgi:PAS domain S-box-containing protein
MISRQLSDNRLMEEQEMLLAVINATTDAIISTDEQGLIRLFNAGAERIFGFTCESMQGQPLAQLLPERFREKHTEHLQRFAASGVSSRMMGLGSVKGLRADGREIDLEVTISQVTVQQQRVLISNLRDVTERVRTDAEFQQTQAQLSELTQKLMVQEKMLVKSLAQELHDQLGQTLAAIRMSHETIVTLQADQAPAGVNRLQVQMGQRISQAIRQVRHVLVGLRPPLLDEQGLAAALDNELRNRSMFKPNLDISLYVQPEIAAMRYPPDVEYAAFMVAREALENALKHSGATSLSVRLSGDAQVLHVALSDNGSGIAPGTPAQAGHLGLLGMHERAHAVGAGVSIEPATPCGTCVRFFWTSTPEVAP